MGSVTWDDVMRKTLEPEVRAAMDAAMRRAVRLVRYDPAIEAHDVVAEAVVRLYAWLTRKGDGFTVECYPALFRFFITKTALSIGAKATTRYRRLTVGEPVDDLVDEATMAEDMLTQAHLQRDVRAVVTNLSGNQREMVDRVLQTGSPYEGTSDARERQQWHRLCARLARDPRLRVHYA